jgi:hypothetical protein
MSDTPTPNLTQEPTAGTTHGTEETTIDLAAEGAEAIADVLAQGPGEGSGDPAVEVPANDGSDSEPAAEPVAADAATGGGNAAPTAEADRAALLTKWEAEIGGTKAPAATPAAEGATPGAPAPQAGKPDATATPPTTSPASTADLTKTRAFFAEEYGAEAAKNHIDPLLTVIETQAKQLEEVTKFVAEQRQQHEGQRQAALQEYNRQVHGYIDEHIASKSDEAKRILGLGKNADATHQKARTLFHEKAVQLLAQNIEDRKINPALPAMTPQDALNGAARALFPNDFKAATQTKSQARKEIESSITKRHQARTLSPSSAASVGTPDSAEDNRQAGIDAIASVLSRG